MIRMTLVLALSSLLAAPPPQEQAKPGSVEIRVADRKTGEKRPSRIHLKNDRGVPVRAPGLPFWKDHFVLPGSVHLELPPGTYSYEAECGPEYSSAKGGFQVGEGKDGVVSIELERLADLSREGWWSGELHVHRPPDDIELLMRAEDLHVAPVITWWNARNLWSEKGLPSAPLLRFDGDRYAHLLAGEDERGGGALLYFDLEAPLAIQKAKREDPSMIRFLTEARSRPGVKVDIEKPFWWDVPVWVALGKVDSIGLANNHMARARMYEEEAWGHPRDAARLPAPRGNGFWSQEIYYHLLNCGLRIPPSAGSASGVLENPVGYNRVYVHLEGDLTYEKWWEGLRAGRSFVTNGPLLRVRANGEWPGHVFAPAREGEKVVLNLSAALASRDPVPAFEIVKDGRVERTVPKGEMGPEGSLGSVTFTKSGWVLVRAIADVPQTFRFASTAPYYVEIGPEKTRVHRVSARFFLDWTTERLKRLLGVEPALPDEAIEPCRKAEEFWRTLEARAADD
jgi:hypothetical protein